MYGLPEKRYKTVKAIFRPKIIETMREECLPYIGKTGIFEYSWIIDEGQYTGQWAMGIYDRSGEFKYFYASWVPEEDLEIL